MQGFPTPADIAAGGPWGNACSLLVLQYVDLDEFLSENGMPGEGLGGAHLGGSAFGPALGLQAPVTKRERSPSPSDCMSPDTINPPLSPADSSTYHTYFVSFYLLT